MDEEMKKTCAEHPEAGEMDEAAMAEHMKLHTDEASETAPVDGEEKTEEAPAADDSAAL